MMKQPREGTTPPPKRKRTKKRQRQGRLFPDVLLPAGKRIALRDEIAEPGQFSPSPDRIRKRMDLTASAKVVATTIVGHIRGASPYAYLTITTIAGESGLGHRTAETAIADLQASGELLVRGRTGRSSLYSFLIDGEPAPNRRTPPAESAHRSTRSAPT